MDKNKILVILDNGHGTRYYTKGKRSPDGRLYEGEWARAFVIKLSKLLNFNGIKTHILVPEDNDITLKNRVSRVNTITSNFKKLGYTVFLVSVHINAAKSDGKYHDANGFTVWVSNNCSADSKNLASKYSKNAKKLKLEGNRYIPPVGYFTSNFYILKYTTCPAVLCEDMFMDNLKDEEFLLSDDGVDKLLNLHVNAILEFIDEK